MSFDPTDILHLVFAAGMKFRKGQSVEVMVGEGWLAATVTLIWRGVDLETKSRIFQYNVSGKTDSGLDWEIRRIPEAMLRRPNRARGRRRVLRAHGIKPGELT